MYSSVVLSNGTVTRCMTENVLPLQVLEMHCDSLSHGYIEYDDIMSSI